MFSQKLEGLDRIKDHGCASDEDFFNQIPLAIFDQEVISFLDHLARILFSQTTARAHPDLVALMYFCRRSNLERLSNSYKSIAEDSIGRGVVFHIAPSNMAMNGLYSLVSGLLSGNVNVLRLSTKSFEQIDIICKVFENMQQHDDFARILRRFIVIRYSHSEVITRFFSSRCDARIVWGADETVELIRSIGLNPHAIDLSFASRISISLINFDALTSDDSYIKLARSFYNDTYAFDQNACSSPHLIVWFPESSDNNSKRERFWHHLLQLVDNKYELKDVVSVQKYSDFLYLMQDANGAIQNFRAYSLCYRFELKNLSFLFENYCSNSGFFFEHTLTDLRDLSLLNRLKIQTLSQFGVSQQDIKNLCYRNGQFRFDRCVPVGQAVDFDLVWDGVDLIRTLSRLVVTR